MARYFEEPVGRKSRIKFSETVDLSLKRRILEVKGLPNDKVKYKQKLSGVERVY